MKATVKAAVHDLLKTGPYAQVALEEREADQSEAAVVVFASAWCLAGSQQERNTCNDKARKEALKKKIKEINDKEEIFKEALKRTYSEDELVETVIAMLEWITVTVKGTGSCACWGKVSSDKSRELQVDRHY